MNATNFFTRKVLGMDYGVWLTMLLVCVLSIGLYGFTRLSFGGIDEAACAADTIRVNGKAVDFAVTCYLNRITPFAVSSEEAATVVWDFKDGSAPENGPVLSHKFIEEGTYEITATVNGRCELKANVEVVYDPFLLGDLAKPVIEIYANPQQPMKGSPVKFYCVTDLPTVASYEWKIINTNEVKNDAVPAFIFQQEESYTIQLMINNDPSTIKTRVIKVSADIPQIPTTPGNTGADPGGPSPLGPIGKLVPPEGNGSGTRTDPQPAGGAATNGPGLLKPDTPKVSSAKAPEIDPDAFKNLLQAVVDQNGKELEDLYKYLDYKESTMVDVNESGSLVPLKDFCKSMREKKKNKRKIESLSFKVDDKKSIQKLLVKIPGSGGFWDKINPFN